MAVWGMHLDFSPDCAGGALFPYLEVDGGPELRHGARPRRRRHDRHRHAARHRGGGGEVRLGAPVRSIVVEAGAAKGVVLASGERIDATRAVIANLHPRVLFGNLVAGALAGDAAPCQASARPGHDDDPSRAQRSAGLERRRRAAAVRLRASRAFARRDGEDLYRGARRAAAAEPALVVGQPTAIDPSRAPPAQHVLWVQVRVLPSRIRGDAARRIAGTDWDGVKEAYADRVIGIIERYAPGLRRQHPRPRGALPRRSRARQSQSRRRRQPRRQSPPRSELSVPAGLRLVALPHAGRTSLYGRRVDLAGAGTGAGSGFMLAKSARRRLSCLVNFAA